MPPLTTRQIAAETLGDFDAFRMRMAPRPTPGARNVLIRVEAAALGYVDGLIALGTYQIKPDLPYVPGGEVAGTIVEIGVDVEGFSVGDRVATWQIGGGCADYIVVAADQLDILPMGLDPITAAASIVDYQTARYALVDRGTLKPGECVLILGAGGGVGAAALQFAIDGGARVIAAASSSVRRAAALSHGASETLDSAQADMRAELRAKGLSGAVNVIFDPVGGAQFEAMFRSLAKEGRHLVVGFAGGAIPALPANLPLLKSASLVGVDIRHFTAAYPEAAAAARRDIFARLAAGRLRPPTVDVYPLDAAPAALAATLQRGKAGKLVVTP